MKGMINLYLFLERVMDKTFLTAFAFAFYFTSVISVLYFSTPGTPVDVMFILFIFIPISWGVGSLLLALVIVLLFYWFGPYSKFDKEEKERFERLVELGKRNELDQRIVQRLERMKDREVFLFELYLFEMWQRSYERQLKSHYNITEFQKKRKAITEGAKEENS